MVKLLAQRSTQLCVRVTPITGYIATYRLAWWKIDIEPSHLALFSSCNNLPLSRPRSIASYCCACEFCSRSTDHVYVQSNVCLFVHILILMQMKREMLCLLTQSSPTPIEVICLFCFELSRQTCETCISLFCLITKSGSSRLAMHHFLCEPFPVFLFFLCRLLN